MSGRTNRYTLNIVNRNKLTSIAKSTLETIDSVTVNFKNKQEFLGIINETFDRNISIDDSWLNITYNQNKKVRYARVLYLNDRNVLDKGYVANKVIEYSTNKNFIIKFVNRYCNNRYLSSLASDVVTSIEEGKEYVDSLQRIIDLTFGSYKSIRDIYLFVKKYDKMPSRVHNVNIPTINNNVNIIEALKTLKSIYEYEQLNLFDLIDQSRLEDKKSFDTGTPKIKR